MQAVPKARKHRFEVLDRLSRIGAKLSSGQKNDFDWFKVEWDKEMVKHYGATWASFFAKWMQNVSMTNVVTHSPCSCIRRRVDYSVTLRRYMCQEPDRSRGLPHARASARQRPGQRQRRRPMRWQRQRRTIMTKANAQAMQWQRRKTIMHSCYAPALSKQE